MDTCSSHHENHQITKFLLFSVLPFFLLSAQDLGIISVPIWYGFPMSEIENNLILWPFPYWVLYLWKVGWIVYISVTMFLYARENLSRARILAIYANMVTFGAVVIGWVFLFRFYTEMPMFK